MSTKKLTDTILESWGQKVICIVLAIVLYVFNRMASLERKVFTVPLKVEASGLMMPVTEIPKYVKVSVRSKAENMPAINGANIFASINFSDFTEKGIYNVPVMISLGEDLILMDPFEYSVKPECVSVDLDTKELAYIPVKPALSGEVEHGYTISKIDVNPSTVKVVGPSRILKKVTHIDTKKVIVSGAATNFSRDVKLDNINSIIKVVPESDFRVTISVIPATDTKVYTGLTPTLTGLNPCFEIMSEIPKISFKVAGTVPVLENYNYNENTVTADCSSIDGEGTFDVPVYVRLPASMALVEKSAETIPVSVMEKKKNASEDEIVPEQSEDNSDSESSLQVLDSVTEEKKS
jgi:YbbR domain-containing protein